MGGPARPGDIIYQTLRKRVESPWASLAASCPRAGRPDSPPFLGGPQRTLRAAESGRRRFSSPPDLELGTPLWGPLIPSLSWRRPRPRARVKQRGYRCVSPAPGSWDLLGSAQCPVEAVGGVGPGSSPGRPGPGCGTAGDPGPSVAPSSLTQSWEVPCQFHRAELWGPSREAMLARGFSGNVRLYQESLLGATSRNFPGGSWLARCPQKCRRRKRAHSRFLPPRPGTPGQSTGRWL